MANLGFIGAPNLSQCHAVIDALTKGNSWFGFQWMCCGALTSKLASRRRASMRFTAPPVQPEDPKAAALFLQSVIRVSLQARLRSAASLRVVHG
ncbi:hypothetical protein OK016_28435 [Vibrio chagasii]|nr:hypothetical protein [Vibrio chagasii]